MTSAAFGRKDKQSLIDFDNHVKEIQKQFLDQIKILDVRTENKVVLVNDMIEFFRRRSELELEFGKSLDKLADRFTERLQKQRSNYGLSRRDRASFVDLWNKLLIDSKFKAKTSTNLGEILVKNVCTRLSDIAEDVQRLSRNVKDTQLTLQEEIMKLISKLQQQMKNYYLRHADFVLAESKLRGVEKEKQKVEESPQKRGNERKIKNIDKLKDKRHQQFIDSKLKSIRARNDYILTVEAVSSVLSKYYDHDMATLISNYDHNFHPSFAQTMQSCIGAEIRVANSVIIRSNSLAVSVSQMDADNDKLMFLEDNSNAFVPQVKFSFCKHADDQLQQISAVDTIQSELKHDHRKLYEQLKAIQAELAEVQLVMEKRTRSLETTYKQYDSEMNSFYNVDLMPTNMLAIVSSSGSALPAGPSSQLKLEKEEYENAILLKFREHILSENLRAQKEAQYDILTKALGEISSDAPGRMSTVNADGVEARNIKLFGTSLKEQVEESGQPIPEIIESCVKYIAKYGLSHQGIFRVPGASQEISDMKKAFEEGRDPLTGLNHWKDINAVAGVFRLYLRELKDPCFPYELNNDYLRASRLVRMEDQVAECKDILAKIPDWNLRIIKFILKFLNLIARYSDQNKMTSHNLAVVFGPTLIRVFENEDFLTNQGQINIFMDVLINEFYALFPDESIDGEDRDRVDNLDEAEEAERTEDELESEDDLDHEYVEAVALYNYTARTKKELSFKKGDVILVFSRTNQDWWEATVNGQDGFVPAPYVKLADAASRRDSTRSEDRETLIIENLPPLVEEEKGKGDSSPSLAASGNVDVPAASVGEASDAKSSSSSVIATSSNELSGNVFASIDPTCSDAARASGVGIQQHSPVTVRRSGSDRGEQGSFKRVVPGVGAPPARVPSQKGSSARREVTEASLEGADELNMTVNAVRDAFQPVHVGLGKQPMFPPSSKLPISSQDIQLTQSKLRSLTEGDVEATPVVAPDAGDAPSSRSGLRSSPRVSSDRPVSAFVKARNPSSSGEKDVTDRPNSAIGNRQFDRPPVPPPAPKPKPRKDETVTTAAASKSAKSDTEELHHF